MVICVVFYLLKQASRSTFIWKHHPLDTPAPPSLIQSKAYMCVFEMRTVLISAIELHRRSHGVFKRPWPLTITNLYTIKTLPLPKHLHEIHFSIPSKSNELPSNPPSLHELFLSLVDQHLPHNLQNPCMILPCSNKPKVRAHLPPRRQVNLLPMDICDLSISLFKQ